jgi:hypothetical protein
VAAFPSLPGLPFSTWLSCRRSCGGLVCGLVLVANPAPAQTARDLYDLTNDLRQQATSASRLASQNRALFELEQTWLMPTPVPGVLTIATGQRRRASALRYNVALHLVEAQDSTGWHVWDAVELRGFEVGMGRARRQFIAQDVRNRYAHRDFIELLSAEPTGPLIVGAQHVFHHEEELRDPVLRVVTRPAVNQVVYELVWGISNAPYRTLQLKEKLVLRLFGNSAGDVAAYARQEQLRYEDLNDVLRMVNYYNQQRRR